MWIAEFKVWHEGSEASDVTAKFDAEFESHYLNAFVEKGQEYVTKVLLVKGRQSLQAMNALIQEVKKRGARTIAVEGNQVILVIKSLAQFHSTVMNSNTFFVGPQIVKQGFVHWRVASWDKKHILELFERIRKRKDKKVKIEILSITQQAAPIFASALLSGLTDKQRQAFEAACRAGYYAYPRLISLEELAKREGLPYTTFKDRLRSAESRLWPKMVFK